MEKKINANIAFTNYCKLYILHSSEFNKEPGDFVKKRGDCMKKFAFYLPQFHEIEENNKWWGKGFTEWTHIKSAKAFWVGHHIQKPLNQNYYNILKKSTVEWQTQLMHQYRIDGLIYYHYYFNGKMLMQKPAENLLRWKDIEQPFFFCWANHSFKKGKREILLQQTYGEETDWEKHFRYLLPFFKDRRYAKEKGKPIFMIFKSDFIEREKMFLFFDKRCREEGFAGICLIETYHGYNWPNELVKMEKRKACCTDYFFIREPAFEEAVYKHSIKFSMRYFLYRTHAFLRKRNLTRKPTRYDGEKLFLIKMQSEPKGSAFIHGLCFEWDNTPRHGKKGYVISPISKDLFLQYMNSIKDEKYLFINAWNEWAEGMVLEPSDVNGYRYLEWIKEWSIGNDQRENQENQNEDTMAGIQYK